MIDELEVERTTDEPCWLARQDSLYSNTIEKKRRQAREPERRWICTQRSDQALVEEDL